MFDVGKEVGARRWPMYGSHISTWQKPIMGVVLARNDPRAWKGTIAFGRGTPSQKRVDEHLDLLARNATLIEKVPVLWAFPGKQEVIWEEPTSLRHYSRDLMDWHAACAKQRAEKLGLAA